MNCDHSGLSKGPSALDAPWSIHTQQLESGVPHHIFPAEKKKTKKQVPYHHEAIAHWYNASSRVSFIAPCDDNEFGVRSVWCAAKMK